MTVVDGTGSVKEFVGQRCWFGLAPDDSLLPLRDIGSQEIHALGWGGSLI